VHTVWDLGWNDAMSIAFVQRSPTDIRIIDHIEDDHRTMDWYVKEIEKRDYRWGPDYLPHDGRTRNYQTGKSTEQLLRDLGRKNVVCLKQLSVEEGIRQARMIFPKTYFDKIKTARMLDCLKHYRRDIDVKTREARAPLHDEYSHSADCFRYVAMAVDLMRSDDTPYRPAPPDDWRM